MITKPTVFVLGAGASVPYGYPTGEGLTRMIRDRILGGSSGFSKGETHKPTGISSDKYIIMAESLRDALKISVDEWLARNIEFQDCGKICIAQAIATREGAPASPDKDWYAELWAYYLLPNCNNLKDVNGNKVVFVTFNYDRSLEHRLFSLIENTFRNEKPQAISDVINQFRIIHVHGHVGFLPWQTQKEGDMARPYGGDDTWTTAIKFSKQIKIISELDGSTPEYQEARKCISVTERIYFLGFGYHDENMRRLKPAEGIQAKGGKWIRGSAYGLEGREHEPLSQGRSPLEKGIQLGAEHEDVLAFMKRLVPRA